MYGFIILGTLVGLLIGTLLSFDSDSKFKWVFLGALAAYIGIPLLWLVWKLLILFLLS